MKEIPIKNYIKYLFVGMVLLFSLNKFLLRPWVLGNDKSGFFQIIVLSVPNLIEAIVLTLLVTGILMQFRQRFQKTDANIKDRIVYRAAIFIAGFYTLSQEFRLHNLGGNNVYDPYDVIASIIGLVMCYILILNFGFEDKLEGDQ